MNQNFYNSFSLGFDQFQTLQYPVIHQPPQETSTEILQAQENLMEAIQVFLKKYDQIPSKEKCIALLLAEDKFFKVKQALKEEQNPPEESIISTNTYIFETPSSIVITTSPPVLPIKDPEVSLIMRNEELKTIPEKESDEFIKSSVEDLVPIPSESEDTFRSESMCILPSCDVFSPIDVLEEKSVTFSNLIFNSNDDFTSSDDESLSDEDVLKDNVKIYSNPLFEFDDEYISSDVNPLFDEGDVLYLESLLNDDLVHHDSSIPAISVASIIEGFTNKPPLKENDDLFDLESKNDEWKKILYDSQIDDLMFEEKVFDPGIHDQIFSPTYDCLDFEDSRARGFVHRLLEFQSLADGNPIS
uniref:Reverse transcriptase domain-containing protein n=1 Tax=Tanacetum cinerariifolium TaxID=118510 RepID=A0A699I7G8_TANCI|nr:hypothetical protein [Tanacetum cinerariifolium]